MVRKEKTDARDAAHVLELLLSGRFPRIWRPPMAERDLRQLVWNRQKLVWMRNAVGNQLHALAMGEGVCRKKKLFPKKGRVELESLALAEQAEQNAAAVLLMTHAGVGPVTSLAFVLTIGPVGRFERSKLVVSHLGLNPREHSSGESNGWGRSRSKVIR